MKVKGLLMSAAILAPMGVAPLSAFADEAPATSNSKVMAEIVSGGMTIAAADANFGKLTIGTEPGTVAVTDFLKVVDHTGGSGYEVNVSAENYDETKDTMATTAKIGDKEVPLTNTAGIINEGESMLKEQKYNGSVTGKWGSTPKAGEFSQDLKWTMTAKAAPVEPDKPEAQAHPMLLAMMQKVQMIASVNGSNLYDSKEQSMNSGLAEVTADSTPRKALNVGGDNYKVNIPITIRADQESTKAEAQGMLFIGGEFKVSGMGDTPATDVIESVDAPKDMSVKVTADGFEFDFPRGAYNAAFSSNEKDGIDIPLTLHLKDGGTGTYTIHFDVTWNITA